MKITAEYDKTGKICSLLIWKGPPELTVVKTPRLGRYVSEIDGLKLPPQIKTLQDVEAIRKIMREHKVAVTAQRCTAIKRDKS